MFKKVFVRAIGVLMMLALLASPGCFAYHVIPAGYVGKLLHPSGFASEVLQPGQVNIGAWSCVGRQTRLVLLEATTITILEQFRAAAYSTDGNDHRIMTKDGVPTVVDMYVRVVLPDDTQAVNDIFTLVTPEGTKDPLETKITLQAIYSKFVEMDTRNRVRDIIVQYESFQDVLNNYDEVNKRVTAAVIQAFRDSNVPLKLQDAQLSQVLPDPQVWDSEVKRKAAEALQQQIEQLGSTIQKNPGYLTYLQWESLKEIAATGSAAGTNTLIIVTSDGQSIGAIDATTWAMLQQLIDSYKPTSATSVTTTPVTTTPATTK